MTNIIYACVFCVVAFLMWVSIIFSYIDKRYNVGRLFSTTLKAVLIYILSSAIALVLTFCTYLTVWFVQDTLF